MKIIRYVNKMQVIGLKEYNLTLVDLLENSELEIEKYEPTRDKLFTRNIPITITIPDKD